ncbi:glycosyltransferase family 2 protein [Chryseobacterium sp. SC28]|uniref:glycosyltransferase family 2 protein n=1 Tax=Chryseobacterium sp. SC28 TaxID=2268028 RepID=UPI000F64F3D2|nr:glycosyltransferase family 2 protein [Chryseobacterium sp. SC28]RRQ47191.1 glycosyltransferase [Chryseobacterium sp. SC28]
MISVITINFNNQFGLEETIKSVVNQSYKDFEFIVIDGGSNDGSKEILETYSEQINYWVSEPDNGIYNAMNKGIAKASGDYLIFMNSGDRFSSPEILEKIAPHFGNEDIVYGNAYYELENRKKYEYRIPSKITIGSLLKEPICHQSAFFKKELFTKFGMYDEQNKIASDWTFMMDLFIHHNISQKYIDQFISIFEKTGISTINHELGVGEQKKYLAENVSLEIQNMARHFDEYAQFYHSKPGTMLRNFKNKIYKLIYRKRNYERKFVD